MEEALGPEWTCLTFDANPDKETDPGILSLLSLTLQDGAFFKNIFAPSQEIMHGCCKKKRKKEKSRVLSWLVFFSEYNIIQIH